MSARRHPSEAVLAPLLATPEDIQTNRAGEITPRQRAMLEGYAYASQRWGAYSLVAVVVLTIVPFGYSFAKAAGADDRWGIMIGLLMLVFFSSISWLYGTRINRRLPNNKLLMACGTVAKHTGTSDYGEYYTLHVGGVAFHLARALFDAFTDGGAYRVYYVAHVPVPIMLSFEPDEPDDGTTTHAYRARHRA